VLSRPKLSKFISTLQTNKVVELYDLVTTSYKLGKIPHIVLDLKDNYLFALADKSKADYLVTGDKLLLEVKEYKKTKTITLADFREITR
jgi:putative PIN family toxin of toxin-antitoxin system